MGKRGPGAKIVSFERPNDLFNTDYDTTPKTESWQQEGLDRAERVIAFLESLTITSGTLAGQKFEVRDWQAEFIRGIYGPVDEQNRRIVRTALFSIPRKNGKTGLIAALVLAHLMGPEAEQRGQIYSAAVDKDQASIIFNECRAMIEANPNLNARVNIQSFKKTITDEANGSIYVSLSSDARKAHGLSPSLWIFDELAQVPNRNLLDALQTATGARKEPLGIIISTQAADDVHPMSELVDYAEKIETGIVDDPSFYGKVYRAPDDADIYDEATWHLCNPALGDFRSLEEMRSAAVRAKRLPSFEGTFRNLYLNQRIDAESRFINGAVWAECQGEVDLKKLAGRPCFGGLDLSTARDLTSLVLVFPDDEGHFDVVPYFWLPKEGLRDKEDEDRVPYCTWANNGHLETTPGKSVDYRHVVLRMAELADLFDIRAIAYDRWRINDLKREMYEERVDIELSEFGQGYKSMSPAIEEFERILINGRLRHGNHPVLKWNASNAVVTMDPTGARKLDKSKSRQRIDGIVALVMALDLARRYEEESAPMCLLDGPLFL
jgi:phage terminase large subunit-like protein